MSIVSQAIKFSVNFIPHPGVRFALKAINLAMGAKKLYKAYDVWAHPSKYGKAGSGDAEWEAYYGGHWRDIHGGFKEDISKAGNAFTRCVRWDGGYRSYRNDRGLEIRRKDPYGDDFFEKMTENDSDFPELTYASTFNDIHTQEEEDTVEVEAKPNTDTKKEQLQQLASAQSPLGDHDDTSNAERLNQRSTSLLDLQNERQDPTSNVNLFKLGQGMSSSNFVNNANLNQQRLGL